MKKSNKSNKSVRALMKWFKYGVMALGTVFSTVTCSRVWAGTTITIDGTSIPGGGYTDVVNIGVDASSASRVIDGVDAITTGTEPISYGDGLFGIKADGANSVTMATGSSIGTILLKRSDGYLDEKHTYGVYLNGTGTNTIDVGTVTVQSNNQAAADTDAIYLGGGTNNINFASAGGVVTVATVNDDYNVRTRGIKVTGGENHVTNLKTVQAGFINDGGTEIVAGGPGYGIQVTAGNNTFAFNGKDSSILVKTNSWGFGIAFGEHKNSIADNVLTCTGTNEVTGLGNIEVSGVGNFVYGILACGEKNEDKFTVSFDNEGDAAIHATSKYDSYGIRIKGKGETEINEVKSIVADGGISTYLCGSHGISLEADTDGKATVNFAEAGGTVTATKTGDATKYPQATGIKITGAGENTVNNLTTVTAEGGYISVGLLIDSSSGGNGTINFVDAGGEIIVTGGSFASGVGFGSGTHTVTNVKKITASSSMFASAIGRVTSVASGGEDNNVIIFVDNGAEMNITSDKYAMAIINENFALPGNVTVTIKGGTAGGSVSALLGVVKGTGSVSNWDGATVQFPNTSNNAAIWLEGDTDEATATLAAVTMDMGTGDNYVVMVESDSEPVMAALTNRSVLTGKINSASSNLTVTVDGTSELHILGKDFTGNIENAGKTYFEAPLTMTGTFTNTTSGRGDKGELYVNKNITITGGTVNNGGTVNFNKAVTLDGVLTNNAAGSVKFCNKGVSVTGINSMGQYVFMLPAGFNKDTDTMLTVTNALALDSNVTLILNPIAAGITSGTVNLIGNTGISGIDDVLASNKVIKNGDTEYAGTWVIDSNVLKVTIGAMSKYISVIPDNVTDNKVAVTSGTAATIGGTDAPTFNNNGGTETVWKNIYGGYSEAADVSVKDNTVTVTASGAVVTDAIYGGYSKSGNVTGNSVKLNGITAGCGIYGGFTKEGIAGGNSEADGNTVEILGGTYSHSGSEGTAPIYGGYGVDASSNKVTVSGGVFEKISFTGGRLTTGSGKNNEINVTGGEFEKCYICGAATEDISMDSAILDGNKITIENGKFTNVAFTGAVNEKQNNRETSNNSVTINNGTFSTCRVGGVYGDEGDSHHNTILINGGEGTFTNIYCGEVYDGNTFNNEITIKSENITVSGKNSMEECTIVAGANGVAVKENVVNIEAGKYEGCRISGGSSEGGVPGSIVQDNMVNISGGTYGETSSCFIYGGGGVASYGANALSNVVNISGGTLVKVGEIVGGMGADTYGMMSSSTFIASSNRVKITGGTVNVTSIIGGVAGGWDYEYDPGITGKCNPDVPVEVKNNTVEISGDANVTVKNIYGAARITEIDMEEMTGYSVAPITTAGSGNTLIIGTKGVSAENVGGFQKYEFNVPQGFDVATDVMLTISGTTALTLAESDSVKVNIAALTTDPVDPITLINSAAGFDGAGIDTIADKTLYKGDNEYDGTFAIANNKLQVTVGGPSKYISVEPDALTGNSVTVNSGTAAQIGTRTVKLKSKDSGYTKWKDVYGAYTEMSGKDVSGNTVTVTTGADIAENVYGGYSKSGSATNNTVIWESGTVGGDVYGGYGEGTGKDYRTGNTLKIVHNKATKTAKSVQNFQNFDFTLDADTKAGDTLLEVATGNVEMKNDTDIKVHTTTVLEAKDEVNLIACTAGKITGFDAVTSKTIDGPLATTSEIKVSDDSKKLVFAVTAEEFEPEAAKAPAEGIAAAVTMVNEGGDLAEGQGMGSMIQETMAAGMQTFGALGGGHSKYKSGSHIDSDGFNFMVGAGKSINREKDKWVYGAFFEYGKSDFETYNTTSTGDGDAKYRGVGVLLRRELKNGVYTEGSLRGGKTSVDWASNNFVQDAKVGYDTDAIYWGFHVAMGKDIRTCDKGVLTPYAKYTFTHTGGDDAMIGDNHYDFQSVDSHRLRGGVRYSWKKEEQKNYPFIGAAMEHEFDSDANAIVTTAAGQGNVNSPSVKGNTGVFEAGYNAELGKWDIGLTAEAYIGKRKGWTGNVNAFYNF